MTVYSTSSPYLNLTHICVTRPQGVHVLTFIFDFFKCSISLYHELTICSQYFITVTRSCIHMNTGPCRVSVRTLDSLSPFISLVWVCWRVCMWVCCSLYLLYIHFYLYLCVSTLFCQITNALSFFRLLFLTCSISHFLSFFLITLAHGAIFRNTWIWMNW